MELVDLYDENRVPLGLTAERHCPKGANEYRMVVHVCLFDSRGRLLIQKRTAEKREELGCPLDLTDRRPAVTVNFPEGFDDFYIVTRDLNEKSLALQKEEVSAVRWVTLKELLAMVDSGEFIPYPKGFLQFLFEMRESFGFPTK